MGRSQDRGVQRTSLGKQTTKEEKVRRIEGIKKMWREKETRFKERSLR